MSDSYLRICVYACPFLAENTPLSISWVQVGISLVSCISRIQNSAGPQLSIQVYARLSARTCRKPSCIANAASAAKHLALYGFFFFFFLSLPLSFSPSQIHFYIFSRSVSTYIKILFSYMYTRIAIHNAGRENPRILRPIFEDKMA